MPAKIQPSYLYYPGCSLEATSREYDLSLRAVAGMLGIDLVEFEGWNCCGASSGHSTNHKLGIALAGRNLVLAEREKKDIAVACPACYVRLRSAEFEVKQNLDTRKELEETTGLSYNASFTSRHLLDIIVNDIGVEGVKNKVTHPVKGLKLVAYYGCYLARPSELVAFGDPENPQSIDRLLTAAGADVREWSGKVDCCGGSLSLSKREIAYHMVADLTDAARCAGAEAIVTACPLCQVNLEMRQKGSGEGKLPVFYFTELLGLAFGIVESHSWLNKHLISPFKLLESHGL